MAIIPIKNLIPQALRRNKIEPQIEATLILEEFNKIAERVWGDKIHEETRALYVKDKILTLAVLSSTVASEIRLNKNNILNSINEHFNKEVVKDIRILI